MRTKTIIGALALCALSLCAFGAATASASGGLTAVTCKEVSPGAGHFSTDHCETPEVAGSNFDTVAIENGTHVTSLNTPETTKPKLTATNIKGLNVVITCDKSHGKGVVNNTVEGGEMKAHGTEIVIVYSGNCKAFLKSNEAKTCTIKGGSITTNKLTSTTEGEHKVKFTPEAGGATPFATFTIEAGTCGLAGVVVEVKGSVIGIAGTTNHSHVTFEEATNGANLTAFGAPAFYDGTEGGFMENLDGTPGATVGLTTESEFH